MFLQWRIWDFPEGLLTPKVGLLTLWILWPSFFLFMYANECSEKSHHWNGNQWWWSLMIAILVVATTADHCSSSGVELKLRWWTRTLPRLEKKHLTFIWPIFFLKTVWKRNKLHLTRLPPHRLDLPMKRIDVQFYDRKRTGRDRRRSGSCPRINFKESPEYCPVMITPNTHTFLLFNDGVYTDPI